MGTLQIQDLIGAYNVRDFGAVGSDNGDDGPPINVALARAATEGAAVYIPPGTYRIVTPVVVPSNATIIGAGAGSVLKLGYEALVDVLTLNAVSNVRIRDLVIDGNRANQTSGTRHAVYLRDCQDCWLENVVAKSAEYHGFRLSQCDRIHLKGCVAKDNGYDGFSISYSFRTQLVACRALDNSMSGASNGYGVEIELLSDVTLISDIEARETSGSGTYQDYGVRETPAQNVGRTLIAGYDLTGNVSGTSSLESSDSARWPA